MNVKELIGEATEYDKKECLEKNKPKSWLKSISAFANTAGGTLVFGISDDDVVAGLSDAKGDADFISEKIKERITPLPDIMMQFHKTDDGKVLLAVTVTAGTDTPYFYTGDGQMLAYIRVGNESIPAGAMDLKRLVLRGKNIGFDQMLSGYYLRDYSFSKFRERYKAWTDKSFEDKNFQSFGICNEAWELTNAGALLADDSPIIYSRVFCTRWNGLKKSGSTKEDALDSAEYSGSLISLLQEAAAFVKRNSILKWKKESHSRTEMPSYSERAVFESLVNAFAHRDYLVTGSEVHVDMFDNRLEIYSPGGMADGTKVQDQDVYQIPSTRRNLLLADLFGRIGYMERKGSGLAEICDYSSAASNYTEAMHPVFYSDSTKFVVTLWNMNYDGVSDKAKKDSGNNVQKDDQKNVQKKTSLTTEVLEIIAVQKDISLSKMADQLSVSPKTVQRMMDVLKAEGRVVRKGGRRYGYWEILK